MFEHLPKPRHFLTLLPVCFVVLIFSNPDHKLRWLSLSLVSAAIFHMIMSFISKREEGHMIFDNGNLPSAGKKNIITGNFFEILKPHNSMKIIKDYHETLGKTFGIFYGPDPWALTMDEEVLQKVFIEGSNRHINRNQFRAPLNNAMDRTLIQLEDDEWRQVRRALNPSFSQKQMKTDNVFGDIEATCGKINSFIRGHPLEKSTGARILDALNSFERFAADVIFKVAYGCENGINMEPGKRDKVVDLFSATLLSLVGPIVGLCIFFGSKAQHFLGHFVRFTAFERNMEKIFSILDVCLKERRDKIKEAHSVRMARSGVRKMVDTMIEAMDSKQIDLQTLKANLFFLFAAGFETTATTLTAMFWLLARHPEIQEKLRQAIIMKGVEAHYLNWCIQETMRLYPAVVGAGRILTEDLVTSKGQTIFKGTAVIACVYSVHRCKDYWGPDADDFRPERFGEPEKLNPVHYFAFGKGLRGCLGQNLAMIEMRALVTHLLVRYRIETCGSTPNELDWFTPNFVSITIRGPVNLRFVELSCL